MHSWTIRDNHYHYSKAIQIKNPEAPGSTMICVEMMWVPSLGIKPPERLLRRAPVQVLQSTWCELPFPASRSKMFIYFHIYLWHWHFWILVDTKMQLQILINFVWDVEDVARLYQRKVQTTVRTWGHRRALVRFILANNKIRTCQEPRTVYLI